MKTNISTSPKNAEVADHDSPEVQEDDFHVEDNEKQGHLVEANGELRARPVGRRHAALVGHVLSGRQRTPPDAMRNEQDQAAEPAASRRKTKMEREGVIPLHIAPFRG